MVLACLSCSESKNDQLDRKIMEYTDQLAEGFTKKECSEQKLSVTECNKVRAQAIEIFRTQMQGTIKQLDEACKKSVLLEDECVEKKREVLKRMVSDGEQKGHIEKQHLNR
jgi:hypothetical protein